MLSRFSLGVLSVLHLLISSGTTASSDLFGPEITISELADASAVITSDLDLDGDLDIVAASFDGIVEIWWHDSDSGEFENRTLVSEDAGVVTALLAVDIDGDAYPDLLVGTCKSDENSTDQGVVLYENVASTGSESDPLSGSTRQLARSLANPRLIMDVNCVANSHSFATADFDVDGRADIAFVSFTNKDFGPGHVYVLRNLDDGTNFASTTFQVTRFLEGVVLTDHPTSVAIAHIDEDTMPDLIVSASSPFVSDGAMWYRNLGVSEESDAAVMFSERHDIFNGEVEVVRVADIDGDGDLDAIFDGSPIGYNAELYWNENLLIDLTATRPVSPSADDLFNSSRDAAHRIFYDADGERTFFPSMAVVDLDSDGNVDVVGAFGPSGDRGQQFEVAMHRNLGGGAFEADRRTVRSKVSTVWAVHVADVDSDGRSDLLYTFGSPDDKVVYRRNVINGTLPDLTSGPSPTTSSASVTSSSTEPSTSLTPTPTSTTSPRTPGENSSSTHQYSHALRIVPLSLTFLRLYLD